MYKKLLDVVCFVLIFSFLFNIPLIYAQDANNRIIIDELDINGLRPGDYDKNGWAKNNNGIWVASPSGAIYRDIRENSWVPFVVNYDEAVGDNVLLFLQNVEGKGLDSKNNIFEHEISINLLQETTNTDGGRQITTNILLELIPKGNAKSLRNTFFDEDENGILSIEDSQGFSYNYDVIITPGKTVKVSLENIFKGGSNKNNPESTNVRELISLLQRKDTYTAAIWSDKGNWACLFELNGFLPIVVDNWSPANTGGYDYVSIEDASFVKDAKNGKSITKKILIGVGIAAVTALAIYGGYKGYQYIKSHNIESQTTTGAAIVAAPSIVSSNISV